MVIYMYVLLVVFDVHDGSFYCWVVMLYNYVCFAEMESRIYHSGDEGEIW